MSTAGRSSGPVYTSVEARDRSVWRAWLRKNHRSSSGVWLVYYKKASGKASVSYAEAVEEALCFGWIDSKIHAVNSLRYRQIFTPRKPRSSWSNLNKERVRRMTRSRRMTAAGMAKIAAARKDGSWKSPEKTERPAMPADLLHGLAADSKALLHFEAFSDSVRNLIIQWVIGAKRPETRRRRIQKTVYLASLNKKPY